MRFTSFILGASVLALTAVLMSGTIKEIISTYKLTQQLNEVKVELEALTAQQRELSLTREKMLDPTYVQIYARGTHLLSTADEQVFVLPKADE